VARFGRFRGVKMHGIDPGSWIDNTPRLREFRDSLASRLGGPEGTRRERAHTFVRELLVAALDDFGTHYIDRLTTHIDEIVRLRNEIKVHYDKIVSFDPARGTFPSDITPQRMADLFRGLETHMKAIENCTPTQHIKRSSKEIPYDDMAAVSDAIHSGVDPSRIVAERRGAPGEVVSPYPIEVPRSERMDVRYEYVHREFTKGDRAYKVAEGDLFPPSKVEKWRDSGAQREVAGGTPYVASHLIANMFGARGDEINLVPGHPETNVKNYAALERRWKDLLERGDNVRVKITAITRVGENHPFCVKVEWTETPKGSKTGVDNENIFMNPKLGASTPPGEPGELISMEEYRKKK